MRKIYLGKSKINGAGIFPSESILKGDFVVFLRGKKISKIYNHKKDNQLCKNWFGIGKNLWIDPEFPLSCINHSCDPNLGMANRFKFIAIKNIKKDEELVFDYSICEEEKEWEMKCHCGSEKCRKVIKSIQYLPKETYRKYLPYIPSYFKKIYEKHNNIKRKNGFAKLRLGSR
jgi:uncharacterized protein